MPASKPVIHDRLLALLATCILLIPLSCGVERAALGSSDRVVFLGDSITELGVKPHGYVTILTDSLTARHPGITVIGAGVSGNKVTDLQARLDRDVISKNPTVVVVYIGINDVWHFLLNGNGTPKDKFETGLKDVITRIQNAGARVILCTPSVVGEKHHGENKLDAQLDEYSNISRKVAKDLGVRLCDLRKAFSDYLAVNNPGNKDRGILTVDSVHLNDEGNRFVAGEILKSLEL
ncbi:MAG TPA: SGNH/GDSL hydrolase family protein [Bacteroidota bacterium]|nr:SGNH/GDSL hydrolase family protein [Bacteroidota bacterium]